jgi:hypothetical protein
MIEIHSMIRYSAFFGVLFATGCASFPTPTESMANAVASVRGAEEVGAASVPQAALKLQLAREAIIAAEKLVAEGENESAHYQALRASNDADLAIALTREDEARKVAKTAETRVDTAEAEVTP